MATVVNAVNEEKVRTEVRQIMADEGLTQRDVSSQTGIAYGTLTPWMGSKYGGDGAKIAGELQKWLDSRKAKKDVLAGIPTVPGFIKTKTAGEVWDVLAFAQAAADFAVVVTGPGMGKTSTNKHYAKSMPRVYHVTGQPSVSSTYAVLMAVAEAVGIAERRADRRSAAICERLRDSGALVIIDEAQHLSTAAVEQVRSLHDDAEVGFVLSGNSTLLKRLHGGATNSNGASAQLSSRVGMRMVKLHPYEADIDAIIAAWEIDDGPAIDALRQVGRKPGALRTVTKTIRLAYALAGGMEDRVKATHIRQAYRQLASDDIKV